MLCGSTLFEINSDFFAKSLFLSVTALLPLTWLQIRWVSCRLLNADGWPPFAIGMIWSTEAESGCGKRKDLSTGWPQMAQTSEDAITIFLFFSKADWWVPSLSGRFLFFITISFSSNLESACWTLSTLDMHHTQLLQSSVCMDWCSRRMDMLKADSDAGSVHGALRQSCEWYQLHRHQPWSFPRNYQESVRSVGKEVYMPASKAHMDITSSHAPHGGKRKSIVLLHSLCFPMLPI